MKITITGVTAEGKSTIALFITQALVKAGFTNCTCLDEDILSGNCDQTGVVQKRRVKALAAKGLKIDIETVQEKKHLASKDVVPNAEGSCKDCGTLVEVTFAPEPYEQDLHGDETPVWMCEECREKSAREL